MAAPSRLALIADAFGSLRQHPLRSALSVLGLVIGVAALVAILALADGLERYAREQIGTTTDLQTVTADARTTRQVDGVTVRRDTVATVGPADAAALAVVLDGQASVVLAQRRSTGVVLDTARTAATLVAADAGMWGLVEIETVVGRRFSAADSARAVVVLSAALAERLGEPATVVGQRVRLGDREGEVVGVVASEPARPAEAYGPFGVWAEDLEGRPPTLVVEAERAEEVGVVAEAVRRWLDRRYPGGQGAFVVSTDAERAEQVRQGMLLFRLVMGLITGISVVVGGVGVMNVLLMTVTERTREIGTRKAVGARRRDVVLQFLVEAVAVAGLGSVLGLAVGLVGVFALGPVLRAVTGAPFEAAFTWGTVAVVGAVAVAVGVVFGTYPALRAARLSPVDAMRHE